MVTYNLAYSAPANPNPAAAGSTGSVPVITAEQLWKAMQHKVRHGDEFVPAITKCTVVRESEDGTEIVRKVEFKPGTGVRPEVEERCVLKAPCRTEFHQDDSSFVQNVISVDAQGALHLTYIYEWLRPNIELGTAEYGDAAAKYQKMAKRSVDSTLDVVREMVKDGRIQ